MSDIPMANDDPRNDSNSHPEVLMNYLHLALLQHYFTRVVLEESSALLFVFIDDVVVFSYIDIHCSTLIAILEQDLPLVGSSGTES